MKNINLKKVRASALALSQVSEVRRNAFLRLLSQEIKKSTKAILVANAKDLSRAEKAHLSPAFIQRLTLTSEGVVHLSKKLHAVEQLKSGLGEIIEKRKNSQGILFTKVRTPLGVLLVIYEARPEVTIDVAALGIKSGNAVILKGGSDALETNKALYTCIVRALKKAHLPEDVISFVATSNRVVTNGLLKESDMIDLVIARGGYEMVKSVMRASTIPVLAHSAGGARVYVDKSADLRMAEKILLNAKLTKPSACNSLDTLVVHSTIAKKFIPHIVEVFKKHGVQVLGDEVVSQLSAVQKASRADWDKEFLSLTVSIKVVKDVEEAVAFVNEHSKKHSEVVMAKNTATAKRFVHGVDAAAVFVNCSPRLHDGYVFGLGAEMGISTSKLHARGPVGLKELTTYKWEVYGKGQIR